MTDDFAGFCAGLPDCLWCNAFILIASLLCAVIIKLIQKKEWKNEII